MEVAPIAQRVGQSGSPQTPERSTGDRPVKTTRARAEARALSVRLLLEVQAAIG